MTLGNSVILPLGIPSVTVAPFPRWNVRRRRRGWGLFLIRAAAFLRGYDVAVRRRRVGCIRRRELGEIEEC